MSSTVAVQSEISHLHSAIARGNRVISVGGLNTIPAKAFVLAQLQKVTGKTLVVVAESNKSLDAWNADLRFFYEMFSAADLNGEDVVLSLPSFENDVYSGVSPHPETFETRSAAFWQILNDQKLPFVLTTARSLATKTVTPEEFSKLGARLRLDEDFELETLVKKLVSVGYKREEPVKNIGEFSLRGGILDVWSPTQNAPARVEFFGDTIDSIRTFDAETQLSTGTLKEISIAPMREFAASSGDFRDWAILAREHFADERFARSLKDRTQFADEAESFAGWENLFPLLHERRGTFFDYLKDAVYVIDEPTVIEQTLDEFFQTLEERFRATDAADELGLASDEMFLNAENLREKLSDRQKLELRALGRSAAQTDEEFAVGSDVSNLAENVSNELSETSGEKKRAPLFLFPAAEQAAEIEISARSARRYRGRIAEFIRDFRSRLQTAQISAAVVNSSGMAERLAEILRDEYETASTIRQNFSAEIAPNVLQILIGCLSNGFEMPSARIIFQTEDDIFGDSSGEFAAQTKGKYQKTKEKSAKSKPKTDAFLSDFRDLKKGDYVVHVDHGIGRFEGLQVIEAAGAAREFMLLIYADNAKLFVPVERLDLVSRYSSGEATQPTLDKLGSIGWQKTKAKAKRAMRDMADELLKLYAERKLVKGFAFSADSPWQEEFEDAFPYDTTDDQATAIDDVKKDMESHQPMDRLLCGDVGFGKTEVAMRAAFKAVMDSKQVAVLTPTTVLAYQHYETFKKRFAAFPVKIELLSRFRNPKEQKDIVKRAEAGEIDVLIGTHRILSADVGLPKLGLVIVDEEQRFGVAHKEKLKKLKKKVDVLTLSATPIPRTLNMSLLGMRDMSVIETPPRDRLAINTQVVQFSDSVIKSAVELEMARSGQVYFIHNRVETIHSIAANLQKIVPNARIVIAHGQMGEKEMEQAMLDFVEYKYDILVATTIIENGIDISRANTIIINRADNYGLSQLYQLRGRVGRSSRRAYAYLLIPGEKELTAIARRRLSAIREFSDLGAGFRIAALDLELRGAGNLLGGQQSGHLDALGFDLYVRMLDRTINELRGDEIEDEISVAINLGIDVSIPHEYIGDMSQRLRTYKRISSARDEATLSALRGEISDRYGKLPESVENLFDYARLRRLAEEIRVISIDKSADGFVIKFNEKAKVSPESLLQFINENQGATFTPSGALKIDLPKDFQDNPINEVGRVLQQIRTG